MQAIIDTARPSGDGRKIDRPSVIHYSTRRFRHRGEISRAGWKTPGTIELISFRGGCERIEWIRRSPRVDSAIYGPAFLPKTSIPIIWGEKPEILGVQVTPLCFQQFHFIYYRRGPKSFIKITVIIFERYVLVFLAGYKLQWMNYFIVRVTEWWIN